MKTLEEIYAEPLTISTTEADTLRDLVSLLLRMEPAGIPMTVGISPHLIQAFAITLAAGIDQLEEKHDQSPNS